MTFQQLERAITAAHRNGEYRLVDELETERARRISTYRDRKEIERERVPDLSRRSFKG